MNVNFLIEYDPSDVPSPAQETHITIKVRKVHYMLVFYISLIRNFEQLQFSAP